LTVIVSAKIRTSPKIFKPVPDQLTCALAAWAAQIQHDLRVRNQVDLELEVVVGQRTKPDPRSAASPEPVRLANLALVTLPAHTR
jgi:hypothetical protein